jgi:hypothetical protein
MTTVFGAVLSGLDLSAKEWPASAAVFLSGGSSYSNLEKS